LPREKLRELEVALQLCLSWTIGMPSVEGGVRDFLRR